MGLSEDYDATFIVPTEAKPKGLKDGKRLLFSWLAGRRGGGI